MLANIRWSRQSMYIFQMLLPHSLSLYTDSQCSRKWNILGIGILKIISPAVNSNFENSTCNLTNEDLEKNTFYIRPIISGIFYHHHYS